MEDGPVVSDERILALLSGSRFNNDGKTAGNRA